MSGMMSGKWSVLIVITLVSFITNLDATIVIVGLPTLTADLDMSMSFGLWTITSFYITNTVLLLPSGRWSDIIGAKRIFIWGFAIFTAATTLCGAAGSGEWLIGFRFLQGAGAAMALAASTPLLMQTFPPQQLGFALGVNNISWVTGSLIGPVAGGALIGEFGWRSMFYVVVPFGIIGLTAGIAVLRNKTSESEEKTDWPGVFTFALGLVALLVALSEGPQWGWTSISTIILFAAFILFWIVFIIIEMRTRHPLFQLSLLNYRTYVVGLGTTTSYCIGYFAVTILLTLYLQEAQGLSPLETGLLFIPLSAPQLFTAPLGGRLADRMGPAPLILTGSSLIGLSLLLLGQLGSEMSYLAVMIPLAVISAATGLSWPSLAKVVLTAVPQRHEGAASGMFWTVYNMCRAISQALALVIVQAAVGTAQDGTDLLRNRMIQATTNGFTVFSAFLGIAVVLGVLLLRPHVQSSRHTTD
ncbi:DHA2 family efflux MFS transporter permease subunit [Paenibacillus sp. J22TS3]|uniref:DHA2 family efflux MFS transporter permease subunit n=1 Tax=Paenibacillus sp. J22TS3 TaxID=2807192 RepID=UPI001B287099|nr:DHA2 family efflux MFS transporter permease subunit [Paenibacillus sp. J22TS3]GIP23053.1 MFS transporter [Paenibacillus sp. J22TS3]